MATAMAAYSGALQLKLAEAGLQGLLSADAFRALLTFVSEVQADGELLDGILAQLKQSIKDDGTVSAAQVQAALRQQGSGPREAEHVTFIDAFTVPRVRFDAIHKRIIQDSGAELTLQPGPEAKVRMLQGRFELLYQRLRRNKAFAPVNVVQANLGHEQHAKLTELTGLKGSVGRRCVVIGLVASQDDGSTTLEDEAAVVPVDLSEARAAGLVTEGCIIVAKGVMGHDGVFRVSEAGFPEAERREELPATAQKLNFFGGPMLSMEQATLLEVAALDHTEDRIVLLSNVWLDRPETFDALHTLLAGFQDAGMIPRLLVFMGNFSAAAPGLGGTGGGGASVAAPDYLALREGFGQLARLVDTYAGIKEGCRCVFVPGPNDPGLGQLLPQPALTSYFSDEVRSLLPNAVFATNPCRIKYFHKELVIFRHDLLKQMRWRCLVSPPADDESLFTQLALTLLQQSTLSPLPLAVQPVHWAHDQALQLYPLPHAVILADASAPQASVAHQGCTVFNPGCLQERLFAAYLPLADEVEPSELPPPGASQPLLQVDSDQE